MTGAVPTFDFDVAVTSSMVLGEASWLDHATRLPAAHGLPAKTPRTLTTETTLIGELRKIRAVGMALDLEESHVGVSCVAAPVFGANKRIRAGLSITGSTATMDPGTLGAAVRTAAFTLSRNLRDAGL